MAFKRTTLAFVSILTQPTVSLQKGAKRTEVVGITVILFLQFTITEKTILLLSDEQETI